MRILSIGNFGRGWDGSICDEAHIADALEKSGHEVVRCQREDFAYPTQNFDFTLIAQWDNYDPEVFAKLPKPLIYWAFDYQADGQEWHERLVKGADLYLSKPLADAKYPNWRWLPQDFAPSFLDMPDVDGEQDIDVLFTGSWVPWESAKERVEMLKAVDKHFNLTIHSVTPDEWKREGFTKVYGPVMDHDLPELVDRAKISISIDLVHTPGFWSDRNAQIMACGGFVLFRYVPMSEIVFRDKIGYSYNTDDCLEKIEHFLNAPDEREAIADKGYDYAQDNLMVENRVSDLLTIVKEIL